MHLNMKKYLFVLLVVGLVVAFCAAFDKNGDSSSKKKSNRSVTDKTVALDYARVPEGTPEQIVEYEGFRVSFNKDNKTPNWVAWELLGSEVDGPVSRSDNFWQDNSVKGCPATTDYTRSGYDRGHLCPAADQKWSEKAMADCFVMTNMAPQNHSLNAGAWNTLENKERNWAKRDSAIVIIAGPIYEKSDTERIGQAGVRVPSAFYKVIIAPYLDEPRGIGFVYPNMSSPGNMQNYSMSIDEVEKITGIDFFYNLPDDIEDRIESVTSFKEWDKKDNTSSGKSTSTKNSSNKKKK